MHMITTACDKTGGKNVPFGTVCEQGIEYGLCHETRETSTQRSARWSCLPDEEVFARQSIGGTRAGPNSACPDGFEKQ
jgi:hypothetical protein